MKNEKLSQQVLMEVLTAEIETLKFASKKINEVAPAVSRKLDEVKNLRFTADVNPAQINQMEAIFKRYLPELDKKVSRSVVLPNWMLISIFSGFLLLLLSLGYNYIQKENIDGWEHTANIWKERAIESGYKE